MKEHAICARKRLYERMEKKSAALLFSGSAPHKTNDQSYHYTPQRNFLYLTNLPEENMILLMTKGDEEEKTYLFIEENTERRIKWEGARLTKEEAHERSGIPLEQIHYLDRFARTFGSLVQHSGRSAIGGPLETLYLDLAPRSVKDTPESLKKTKDIRRNYPELKIKDLNSHTAYLRMFKSEAEIDKIKQAIHHTGKGLSNILANLSRRTHEYQLQADFLHAITLSGSEGTAFDTIAASGKNATVLHYTDNKDPLDKKDLILFDLGALHESYAADISRTFPLSGKYSKRQREVYEAVLRVQKETIKKVRPDMTWKDLNAFAKERLTKEAQGLGLLEGDEGIEKYYYHTVGHFLGLDVHDVGFINEPFRKGMVLTIEPGLYIAEEGIGVRIEDNILVTDKGALNLSESIPKDPDEIERIIGESS